VTANVSHTIGLVPGSLSGAIGYRAELTGQRARLVRFGAASLGGGIIGAVLPLTLPSSAFDTIVPVLTALDCLLVVFGPGSPNGSRRAPSPRVACPIIVVVGVVSIVSLLLGQ
jgi:uncharacterized membrane protein YfcA